MSRFLVWCTIQVTVAADDNSALVLVSELLAARLLDVMFSKSGWTLEWLDHGILNHSSMKESLF